MKKRTVSYLLLAASGVLIAAGAALAQSSDVWTKAARICLECVGIG